MASGVGVRGAGVGSSGGWALGVVVTSVVFIVSLPYPGSVNRPRQGSRLDTGRLQPSRHQSSTGGTSATRRRPGVNEIPRMRTSGVVMGEDPDESCYYPFTSFLD